MVLMLAACGGEGRPLAFPTGGDTDQIQPALTAIVDPMGKLWIVAGYTDLAQPDGSTMGLSLRSPDGTWTAFPPLAPNGESFRPSGDAWLAAAQSGGRAYYISLLETANHPAMPDEVGDGLALAVVDVRSGSPQILPPRRIDFGEWPSWDEPTIAATHPPGAIADTVIAAGTPIGPDLQDAVAVLVSQNGGESFGETTLIHAPDYPGHNPHQPDNTLVRPFLQQDPRPGQECHAYLAYGVYYATALSATYDPPACAAEAVGCRSIAETESHDCGVTWGTPSFIAVDTGAPTGEDFRGFSYAVANDGTRFVMFGDEDAVDAPILLKRAAPGMAFTVVQNGRWDDGPLETLASGPSASGATVRRWRPTLAASDRVAAMWVEEDASSHASAVWMSTFGGSWSAPARVDDAGVACDSSSLPSDDYMGVVPQGPFGGASNGFVVAWAPFEACGSQTPRRVRFKAVP